MEKLKQFLVKAKSSTYALGGEGSEKVSDDGRKEFEFGDGKFLYRDSYFGHDPFIGEEIVWENGKTIWGMNYYGKVISEEIDSSSVYSFLKEALKTVDIENPFRGQKEFSAGDFVYKNSIEGDIENFEGKEDIYYKNKLAYKLSYSGGIVK